jgi:hypothetical protein
MTDPNVTLIPAPATPEALARQRAGNSKGGKAARRQSPLALKTLDLNSLAGRQAARDALIRAVAAGTITGRAAAVVGALLRDAAADSAHDQAQLVARLEATLRLLNDQAAGKRRGGVDAAQ